MCIEIDELEKYLYKKFKDDEVNNELIVGNLDEKRHRFVYMWSLIPLTRAIDTLVITLKDPNSPIGLKLFELHKENPDFIEWH